MLVLIGSITCGCTTATPETRAISAILAAAQEPARGEARAHAHPLARHRDLAEHEAVAALDEAADALGHGAERHEARHAHRDAEHGEEVAPREARRPRTSTPVGIPRDPGAGCTRRLMRTMAKKSSIRRRILRGMRRKPPPARMKVTAFTSPRASRGFMKISRNWRIVELGDEAREGPHASPHLPGIAGEARGDEALLPECLQDLLRRDLPHRHREEHARGEDRVHEGHRVAHAQEAVARDGLHRVGEVRRGVHGRHLPRALQVVPHALAARDHGVEEILGRAVPALHRARVEHTAHAGLVAGERDVPEPPLRKNVDAHVALFPARPALGPLEVGEDRHLAEPGHGLAPALPRGEKAVAPAGVHEEAGSQRALALRVADARGDAVGVEGHLLHGDGLEQAHARLGTAWSRSTWSNSARCTSKVKWGHGRPRGREV